MPFEINGTKGYYDGKIENDSERYGRNSVANHQEFVTNPLKSALDGEVPMLNFMPGEEAQQENIDKLEKFVKDNDNYINSLPPLEYEYRYMPKPTNEIIDKKALYGAASEEMGAKEISVQDFDNNFMPSKEYSAEVLDINKDGKISVPEYSASLLAADILSKDNPSSAKPDGSMNSKGMNAVMEYARISNVAAATKLYSQIHSTYNLSMSA